MKDSEIAERMLKLFDGGVHWTRGRAYQPAHDERPDRWCLIGAYRQVVYGKQEISFIELDATPFVQRLARRLRRRYPGVSNMPSTPTVTSANDYWAGSYESIRQILEEVISDGQAECGSARNGSAPD